MPVPASVLAAWGLRDSGVPLQGGQGTSVRVGGVVLKPDADESLVAWTAGLCSRIAADAVRVPAPVPALDGRLVVEGWMASAYAEGEPVHDDDTSASSWLPVLAAGRAFHAAVAGEAAPALLAARADRWASADRAAWGEEPVARSGDRSGPLLGSAWRLVVDEGLPAQLVHGDLSGNVLLAAGLPPAVIDVSPYWRPAGYADAVVAVDALLWWRSEHSLLALARPEGLDGTVWRSLLARAVVFRLLAFDEPNRDEDDVEDQLPRYAEVVNLLRASSSSPRD